MGHKQVLSGPGSNDNEWVLCILESWSLAIRLFYVTPRTLKGGGGSYLSVEMQSVYSTAPANWANLSRVYSQHNDNERVLHT